MSPSGIEPPLEGMQPVGSGIPLPRIIGQVSAVHQCQHIDVFLEEGYRSPADGIIYGIVDCGLIVGLGHKGKNLIGN